MTSRHFLGLIQLYFLNFQFHFQFHFPVLIMGSKAPPPLITPCFLQRWAYLLLNALPAWADQTPSTGLDVREDWWSKRQSRSYFISLTFRLLRWTQLSLMPFSVDLCHLLTLYLCCTCFFSISLSVLHDYSSRWEKELGIPIDKEEWEKAFVLSHSLSIASKDQKKNIME